MSSEPKREVRVIKSQDRDSIPDRKALLLKRFADMESELGRLAKLINEMRADVLHLSVE